MLVRQENALYDLHDARIKGLVRQIEKLGMEKKAYCRKKYLLKDKIKSQESIIKKMQHHISLQELSLPIEHDKAAKYEKQEKELIVERQEKQTLYEYISTLESDLKATEGRICGYLDELDEKDHVKFERRELEERMEILEIMMSKLVRDKSMSRNRGRR